jgi:hypothetical protein
MVSLNCLGYAQFILQRSDVAEIAANSDQGKQFLGMLFEVTLQYGTLSGWMLKLQWL